MTQNESTTSYLLERLKAGHENGVQLSQELSDLHFRETNGSQTPVCRYITKYLDYYRSNY